MGRLRLSFACSEYDRTRPLLEGTIQPDGIELVPLALPIEQVFFRMLRYHEFDVAEMSFSSYVMSLEVADRAFIAIPVFVSRYFRHSGIYVNTSSGIKHPRDLVGKRVGVPEYQMTAAVWIRGILQDDYGVPVDSVEYFTGGLEQPGRQEKLQLSLPPNIRVRSIGDSRTLSEMLESGELDALYSARPPSCFLRGSMRVRQLFDDVHHEEIEYYKRHGIFPIMHTVAIRREIYEQNRWIANSLYQAFRQAKAVAEKVLHQTGALPVMLPWLGSWIEETQNLMGSDFWPYGISENKAALETFLRYQREQGLIKGDLSVKDLFAPETEEDYKV